MIAKTPSSLVPKLRFPEFHKAGDWDFQPLSSVAGPISEKIGTTKCVPMSITTGAGLVSQEDKFGRIIAGDSYKNYIRLQTNDFAYNKSATKDFPQGYIARYAGAGAAGVPSSIFTCFRPDASAVIPEYLDHLFHSNHHGRWLCKYITVGARAHGALSVSDNDLFAMPVPFPPAKVSRDEQKKIADCLDSLDELIAAEGRKLEALRQHKQGLMVQLFPQGDESVPRLRFPEFEGAPEWVETTLGKLCDIKHGYAFEGEFFSDEGRYVLLTPGNFHEQGGYRDRGEKQKYYTGDIPRDYVLNRGDLLVAMTEQAAGLLGSSILVLESDKFLHNQRLGLVTKKVGVAWSNEFFFYVFNRRPVRDAIHCSASGMKVRHTSPTKIGQVVVSVPASLSEQQRIAGCLSALDVRIDAQTGKLDALKQHKQGLLQQLFPSLECTP